MGDRANVKFKDRNGQSIYLYTHWEGCEWPAKLQAALKAGKDRWNDPEYLTRFCITEMCANADGPTGYGVSIERQDNEHDVLEVDLKQIKVRKLCCKLWHDGGTKWEDGPPAVLQEWTFQEFIDAKLQDPDEEE